MYAITKHFPIHCELSKTYSSKVYILDENQTIVTSNSKEAIGTTLPYSAEGDWRTKVRTIVDPETGEQSFYSGREMSGGWGLVTLVSTRQFYVSDWYDLWYSPLVGICRGGSSASFHQICSKESVWSNPTDFIWYGTVWTGNLDVRVQLDSKDEFGQIGTAYNQMADNIQNLLEKVLKMEIAERG